MDPEAGRRHCGSAGVPPTALAAEYKCIPLGSSVAAAAAYKLISYPFRMYTCTGILTADLVTYR